MKKYFQRQPIIIFLSWGAGLIIIFNAYFRWPGWEYSWIYCFIVQYSILGILGYKLIKQRRWSKYFDKETARLDFWLQEMSAAYQDYEKAEKEFDTPAMSAAEGRQKLAVIRFERDIKRLEKMQAEHYGRPAKD